MNPLEIKIREVELIRVGAAKAELEFRIMERMDEIERIKINIDNQTKREEELKTELDEMNGKNQ